ncbi:hypothetical protein [Kitasatospora sp. KL5]|uniref:hypothetical protein n=1 Tax=Kitasatospora sp. KL5 TaxID=3425125 RepID=UPI003D6F84ED
MLLFAHRARKAAIISRTSIVPGRVFPGVLRSCQVTTDDLYADTVFGSYRPLLIIHPTYSIRVAVVHGRATRLRSAHHCSKA